MRRWLTGMLFVLASGAALAAVRGEAVEYRAGGVVMKGYLAYDDALPGRRPGVLVVHEWWGSNEYARGRARMLAELGYSALAVDMYGAGRQADHPDTAGKFAGEVRKNLPAMRARFEAARKLLKRHKTVDGGRLAAIGYCFGGSVVLEMARAGADLAGVVSFHGGLALSNPARKGGVRARVLVLNGADDPLVTPADIATFKQEMEAAGADYRFVSYPGARHSFTNPGADEYGKRFDMPLAYNAEADRQSWAEMQAFLTSIFRK